MLPYLYGDFRYPQLITQYLYSDIALPLIPNLSISSIFKNIFFGTYSDSIKMDAAVDMGDPSKALELPRIRFQLMYARLFT